MNSTITTFKQPFLSQVEAALEDAVSIAWEGCHKIYIMQDEEAHRGQVARGYDCYRVDDKDEALDRLYQWFATSCGLRFITAIRESEDVAFDDQYVDVIAQFDYDTEEADSEGVQPS